MNLIRPRIRIRCCHQLSRSSIRPSSPRGLHTFTLKFKPVKLLGFRLFATQRETATTSTTLLSNALDQRQRAAQGEDSVGPFRLGLIPPTPRDDVKVKKWSELSTGGKVVRSTVRASNVVIIIFGASLSAVLVYALTSEMFSSNSPTVLYGQACDTIKASPRVAKYLQGPLTFHNNPPTGIRPRHRNHHLSSQLAVDSQGKEHMLLNFYVKGQPPGSDSDSDSEHGSCWESASQWAGSGSLPEMSFEAHMAMAREKLESVAETCRQLFKFLSGEQVPTPRDVAQPSSEVMEEKKETGWMSSITGIFSGLKGPSAAHIEHFEDPAGPVDTDGEVHADLVMNDRGYFEFRYLLIDIPDSHARNPKRIFVIRSDGVRETERVMRWHR